MRPFNDPNETKLANDGNLYQCKEVFDPERGHVWSWVEVTPEIPTIEPPVQTTTSSGAACWSVSAPKARGRTTTLTFAYGDGVVTTESVPQGHGNATFVFCHTFNGTGTYVQTSRVVETGAESVPAVTEVQFSPPVIDPPVQFASTCVASYTVRVERNPSRPTTLRMDYGDGLFESRAIPQGTGTEAVTFSHVFGGTPNTDNESSVDFQAVVFRAYEIILQGRDPRDALDVARLGAGAFSQRAKIVETGASSYALTLHR